MDWDKADLEEQGQEDYQPFYGKDEEMKTNVKVRFDHSLTDNYEVEKTGEFTRALGGAVRKGVSAQRRGGPTDVRGGAAGEHGRAAGEGVRGVRAVV